MYVCMCVNSVSEPVINYLAFVASISTLKMSNSDNVHVVNFVSMRFTTNARTRDRQTFASTHTYAIHALMCRYIFITSDILPLASSARTRGGRLLSVEIVCVHL